ncbi:hypothetical protein [Flammeovirga sp. SubArs3]|uniref:hypothetical protein n=1 Tax=Flammeovirga sp. SubArs3 TaxID=2995316 RepID=UPI00248C4E02|nr:hypothetical protein [Flammeovirga sp. SubArs3]
MKLKDLVKKTILGAMTSIVSSYPSTANDVLETNKNDDGNDELKDNEFVLNKLTPDLSPKLLLRQFSDGDFELKMHRSHRSHQSHRSHYSSNSGHASHFSHYSSSTTTTPTYTSPSYNNNSSSYTSPYTAPPVKKSTKTRVKFKNTCGEKIYLLLRYKDMITNQWTTKAWFTIETGATVYVENVNNTAVYYYAYSDSFVWNGEDNIQTYQGKSYHLRRGGINRDSEGNCVFTLYCK